MASFVKALCVTVSSPRTRDQTFSSSTTSLKQAAFCKSTAIMKYNNSKVRVKAMGRIPKFKGTQRREKHLTEMIEKKVVEAKQVCEGHEDSDECKVAWDEVEEVSQAKADLRHKLVKQDPLEYFCRDNPETDECRIYED